MRHHQYAYGISISVETRTQENSIWDTIVKADLSGKTRTEWKESGCYPSETLMIPDPEASETEEDKGILISVVLDTKVNRSFILFLDGRDLHEIARAYLPCSVPFGFHGSWTRKMLG
ncbi:carotenoid oxygenase [Paraphysoderma sedebokerense]|nr:carotenoid oxygenase [Paraphysoderma sedebokerense]